MQVPRVEMAEMGPSLDLSLRRFREASVDLQREAHKQHKPTKKKVQWQLQAHLHAHALDGTCTGNWNAASSNMLGAVMIMHI